MPDGEPTLGEVLRRLNEVSGQMTALGNQMAQDRRDAADTYVRRDVYDARHAGVLRRVDEIEADADTREKAAADFRRQLLFIVLGTAIPAVFALLLAINNFLANGAATP